MSPLCLSLLLAIAPPPAEADADGVEPETEEEIERPTVYLATDPLLAEWMVWRLLEDGYPLTASSEAADVELVLESSAEGGWTVTAIGESTVVFDVEAATDLAVFRLELLHRSLDALEDVIPKAGGASESATVGLTATEPSVAPRVAAEILAAGATLVPAGATAQLRVCANGGSADEAAQVSIIDGASECDGSTEPTPFRAAMLPTTTERVEAAMAALAQGDEEAPALAAVEDEVSTIDVFDPEPAPIEEKEEPVDEGPPGLRPDRLIGAPIVLRGGVTAGAIARASEPFGGSSTIDAVFTGSMTIGWEPGLQGWLELQVRPTNVVGALEIVEVVPAVGAQLRMLQISRFSMFLGALVGPEIHSYQLRTDQLRSQGAHVGGSAEGVLGFAVKAWKEHEVQLALRMGGGAERQHFVDGERVWLRKSFRLGATLGFAFGRTLRR